MATELESLFFETNFSNNVATVFKLWLLLRLLAPVPSAAYLGVDKLKPNGSVFAGVTMGSGPQSKLGAGEPDGEGLLAGNFFNFGEGPCREPPIIRRLGPRSCRGDSSKEAGFQGSSDAEKESNPYPRLGVVLSSLIPNDFCGVAKARGGAGALSAFVFRRGCCRADNNARLSLCADTSPFRALAAFTTTDGAVL